MQLCFVKWENWVYYSSCTRLSTCILTSQHAYIPVPVFFFFFFNLSGEELGRQRVLIKDSTQWSWGDFFPLNLQPYVMVSMLQPLLRCLQTYFARNQVQVSFQYQSMKYDDDEMCVVLFFPLVVRAPHLGRPQVCKETRKMFKATLALVSIYSVDSITRYAIAVWVFFQIAV